MRGVYNKVQNLCRTERQYTSTNKHRRRQTNEAKPHDMTRKEQQRLRRMGAETGDQTEANAGFLHGVAVERLEVSRPHF
jgi:hypothetical protein